MKYQKHQPTRRRAGVAQTQVAHSSDRRFGMSRGVRRIVVVGLALGALASGVLGGLVTYAALTLPNVDDIGKTTGTIKILDVHGQLIAEVGHDNASRQSVKLGQVAQVMRDSTLAAEDRNFYSEGALDVPRIGKALIVDVVLRQAAEGASTITQQLAKHAFFGQQADKSPLRKLREALLAKQIDDRYSKDQILEDYLNITYYGENAYGIEDAAKRFFGKDAAQLTMAESAMLAGLPQAPSYNDPFSNSQAAFDRMHTVLTGLVAMGKVSQTAAAAVDPENPDANVAKVQQAAIMADINQHHQANLSGPAPHFAQYVQNQLHDQFQDDPAFLEGNLTVYTTLDLGIQAKAQQAVTSGVGKLGKFGANNGALLMIDANSGAIEAMVGSADFSNDAIAGQFNVTTAMRRPGSSFKPYVYETGFQNGTLKPDSLLNDTAAQSQKLGGVQDFDRKYLGVITAAQSLLNSRNISTEQAMETAGVQNVIDFAHKLGITDDLAANASTSIGTSAIKMIDHVGGYAAFANGGHKVTAFGILKVVDGKNNVLLDNSQPGSKGDVMTPQQAWAITNILRGYSHRWGVPVKYDSAAKSGTTDNFVDAWYMVYTPDWVVATWAGKTSGTDQSEQPMNGLFGTTEGTYIAAPFINSLPTPKKFTPVAGSLQDCAAQDVTPGQAQPSECPTPTPSPTPAPTPTPSATAAPSPSPTPSPTLPLGTPTACLPAPPPTPIGC